MVEPRMPIMRRCERPFLYHVVLVAASLVGGLEVVVSAASSAQALG